MPDKTDTLGLDIEELEPVPVEGESESGLPLVEKALDVAQKLAEAVKGQPSEDTEADEVDTESEEDVEKADDKFAQAAKGALRILNKYAKQKGAPQWLKDAVASLASGLGYEKYPGVKKSEDSDEVEKAGEVEAIKAALKVFQKVWDKLPKEAQDAVTKLASAIGYPEYKKPGYPEVEKSAYVIELEKTTQELSERLEKAEKALAEAEKQRRMLELEEVSKSVGNFNAELLYKLEQADKELFEAVVKHMETLQKRAETAGLFSEVGTSAPAPEGSPIDVLDRAARELLEKGEAPDYGTALSIVSSDPKYQDALRALWTS